MPLIILPITSSILLRLLQNSKKKKKKTEGNTHAHPLLAGIRHAIVTDS